MRVSKKAILLTKYTKDSFFCMAKPRIVNGDSDIFLLIKNIKGFGALIM
jgi:hypothetical protein